MYCKTCGKQIDDNSLFCSFCGSQVTKPSGSDANTSANPCKNAGTRYDDDSNFGFAVLSFLFPIIGLVLFLIYEKNRPLRAKSCIRGTIAGAIVQVVLFILVQLLFMIFAGSMFSMVTEEIFVQNF